MKKTLLTTLALSLLLPSGSLFADNDVKIPITPIISTVSVVTEKEEVMHSSRSDKRHEKIHSRASNLIKERINSLNSNSKVINADKSLTLEQKATLTGIASTNVTGLTALSVAIATSTDATSTKNLINSIITNFRIYGIVIPQIRLEKRIFDLQNHSQKLSNTFLKVQAKIDEYKGKGKDVTIWQKNLDDAKMLVANDMFTLANLLTIVQALKPSDYGTSSKATIEQVNAGLKAVHKDFNSIRKSVQKPVGIGNSSRKVKDDEEGKYSPLFGTSWVWSSSKVDGVTTQAPTGGKFVLSFKEDNRVTSTTDCNGIDGSYSVKTTDAITFGQFMSTMMFCEGSQESVYVAQLMKTTKYNMEGTILTLSNASGTMVFVKK